ncbi:TetR/AcrR family transcriptional regulator C-terminal domain-containing protein [Nonomuraea sp. MCN248]|uniref:TetR/AcrR family transcriptional regulator C-terminal domain-containing protein n=1 Tax=Nonomuraea corallina TaxID=2989783 RepID=A0ABT4SJR1_9ACTN|nr:TetR/AcrR family transcriptional regulator C-terminal domain-containing protein [Nonomuraea corallina]MDA0637464.1 TetR/AcrR family transcriptional regulator C-terminal domain-containing protein [Nonomuraea corallina]
MAEGDGRATALAALRLAAEADYRSGEHTAVLALLEEARRSGDPTALAEAADLAHQCLMGPGLGEKRHEVSRGLLAAAFRTGCCGDLLLGLLWRTVDHILDAHPHTERCLAELRGELARWRAGLRDWAFALRAVSQRRPWLTRVPASGPPSGPNQIAWMEAALAILSRTRLDWAHKVGILTLINGYVVQWVRQYSELAEGRAAEGQGQADAERDYGRALVRLVDPGRFPETARLFASALFETLPPDTPDATIADADFSLGLELILDGVAVRVERS